MEKKGTFGYVTANPLNYMMLKEFAEKMKKNPTEAEALLWRHLQGRVNGFRFRRQYIIGDYIADFVCLPLGLIVEVDGGYHYSGGMIVHDAIRSEELNNMGFDIIRFTNEEVIQDPSEVVSQIIERMNHISNE
ncbi:MAG: endonuclease domain-containing protein [Bacteroidaceae bacterium]|nr:endonuclease domain-containing protein [Bacteroidaceae bacterium]